MFKEESRTKLTLTFERRPVKTSRKNVKRRSTFGIEQNIYIKNMDNNTVKLFSINFILTMPNKITKNEKKEKASKYFSLNTIEKL